MGTWKNRIALINTEENGYLSPMHDPAAMDLLFCFSQVDEKSEDWNALIAKAEQFMRKDGVVKQESAARIEKVLNDWATGKNSPLGGERSDDPDAQRFSAPSYLFRGYNALKQYFTSIGVNLEESMPKLKEETKECAQKVALAAAQPATLPSLEGDLKAVSDLRSYIANGFQTAFYYGVQLASERNVKPVNPYLNESAPAKDALNRLDESLRSGIRTAYESIKDSKKWYGKDDAEYTSMMDAVRDYTDTFGKEKEAGAGADKIEKMKKAMEECSQYLEKHDGVKFTSVGAKRRDAVKKMLDWMNQLPEAKQVHKKIAAEKRAAEKQVAEKQAAEKLAAEKQAAEKQAAEKLAAEKQAAEKQAAEKQAAEKKAVRKPVAYARRKPAEAKPAGPVDRDEEWFRMASVLMKQEKAAAQGFQRMDKVMEQYKTMTAKDQARVRDMWVNKYEMGEDTWKMLKERNGIKEKVSTNFKELKKEEEKPKMSKMSQKVMKEAEKEMGPKKKDRSMSF